MVRERVERPGGEVPERGHRPPVAWTGLPLTRAIAAWCSSQAMAQSLPTWIASEHRPPASGRRKQGEHAEGLLGREGEVIADPYRRRPPPFEERGELVSPRRASGPAGPRWATR